MQVEHPVQLFPRRSARALLSESTLITMRVDAWFQPGGNIVPVRPERNLPATAQYDVLNTSCVPIP